MMSSLEKHIYHLLCDNNVVFEREKQFKDLRNGYMRFDFFLPELNTIIETNGVQHYKYTKVFHKKKTDFLKAQERDRLKISYCLARGIKIYCIPYWDIESITVLGDIFQDRYLARTKFHNDEAYRLQKHRETN